jgi:mannan endo-1,4-beta-mannosidase
MNCPLAAEYKTMGDGGAPANQVQADFQIYNNMAVGQDLTTVSFRYWFLANSAPMLTYSCDYALLDCKNVSSTFVSMTSPTKAADTYLEVTFGATAGMLGSGSTTGPIEGRIHDTSYQTMFTPASDYSFNGADTAMYTQSTTVTVYNNKMLVWGVEP